MALNRVEKVDGPVKIRRVLMSVYDKTGIVELAEFIAAKYPEVEIYSTGGTFNLLKGSSTVAANLVAVSEYTGQPEMQGGLVKTLDFKIYLGLLSETYNPNHREDLARTGAQEIDLVVVNLYPFKTATADPNASLEDGRTHIDIGGPSMLRAAAKNFLRVTVITDPGDYAGLKQKLEDCGGCTDLNYRLGLAQKVFSITSEYDAAITDFFGSREAGELKTIYEIQGEDRG